MWPSHYCSLNFLSATSLKMHVEKSAFQKSKSGREKTNSSIYCCSPTGYMPDSGIGCLHWFQLIVVCRIHAAFFQVHSARWLPTSKETACSVHCSIYRPIILIFNPVTPLVCALFAAKHVVFEQMTRTTFFFLF